MTDKITYHLSRKVSIAPLVVFRVLFGLMMFLSIIRFWSKGWISEFYIQPDYYFSYWGFEWVKPFDGFGMYVIFILMGLSALGIMCGLLYRLSAASFFLLFTYVELLDKTYYLNHYYFVSLIAFIMIWLPANRFFFH